MLMMWQWFVKSIYDFSFCRYLQTSHIRNFIERKKNILPKTHLNFMWPWYQSLYSIRDETMALYIYIVSRSCSIDCPYDWYVYILTVIIIIEIWHFLFICHCTQWHNITLFYILEYIEEIKQKWLLQ